LNISVYEKVRSGDTQRIVYQTQLLGAQSSPIWVSPALMLMHGWDVTLTPFGSPTCEWSIRHPGSTVTEAYSGTEAIGATEHSMTTDTAGPDVDTTDGVFQAFLDLSDMVAGDQLQFRIYEKATSGGTQRVVYESIVTGPQAEPIWVSPTLILMHGWDMTLDALAGTITVNWSIRQVG
jgi:hypothetical protein